MRIFVKSLAGRVVTLDVQHDDRIAEVKVKIHDAEGFPSERQRLVFSGVLLADDRTLSDYGIDQESTLHMLYFAADSSPSFRQDDSSLSSGGMASHLDSDTETDSEDLKNVPTSMDWVSLRSLGQRNSSESSTQIAVGGFNIGVGSLAVGLICLL